MEKTKVNWNPTNKQVFVLYECINCGRVDCSYVPPVQETRLPFFITCDCGKYVMYQQAWIVEPYNAIDILIAWVSGDQTILQKLRPGGEFKEVTDQLDPDGVIMHLPNCIPEAEAESLVDFLIRDRESLEKMYV